MALPRLASLKLIVEDALTSTVCAVDPTVSLKLSVAGWLTSDSVCCSSFPKPAAITEIVYVAGRTLTKLYSPFFPTFCPWLTCMVVLVRVTVAPWTKAPVGSVMVPRTEVVAFWPNATTLRTAQKTFQIPCVSLFLRKVKRVLNHAAGVPCLQIVFTAESPRPSVLSRPALEWPMLRHGRMTDSTDHERSLFHAFCRLFHIS
jgi:hypothetical protein